MCRRGPWRRTARSARVIDRCATQRETKDLRAMNTTLDQLFTHFLRDVYYAERQILKALPKMVKAAHDPNLKAVFTAHREETVHQVHRLEQVFEKLGKPAKAIPCEAIKGLLEEGEEIIETFEAGPVCDAG